MFSEGWSIKIGNLADPIKFSNKPKLTHSTAKGGTSFSFDIVGKTPLPWTETERAKIEVLYSGEQVFVGNILSRSRDFDNYLTSYNALGYYTHTRRNPIIAKFNHPFSFIINQLLDTSGARPFITNVRYQIGNIVDSENSILDTVLERQYIGQYLDACLDDLCKSLGIQWFIEPETGFLVLWQHSQISSNKEIDVEANRLGQCQSFNHDSLKPSFIYPEITRVVVAKNSESLLNRGVPQMDSINNYLILPNSPTNQVDLLKKTNTVKQYFITPNQPPCNLTINPFFSSFPKEGGQGSFDVIDDNGCSWNAISQDDWITLTGNTSGNGNGVVAFSVAPNEFAPRSGSILVEGEQNQVFHTVDQAGIVPPNPCDYSYFALTAGNANKILLTNTPLIPKEASADIVISPYQFFNPPADAQEGTYSEDYTITLDLTHESLTTLSTLTLDYYSFVSGSSIGLPANFGTFPAASYSANSMIEVSGVGVSQNINTSIFYEGGGTGEGTSPGFYFRSEEKSSSIQGSLPPIDLRPAIGSVVTINVHLEATLTPGSNGYSEEFTNLALISSRSAFSLYITCH
jgi:hypothetical protein